MADIQVLKTVDGDTMYRNLSVLRHKYHPHEKFDLHSPYSPSGDQPQAIDALVKGIQNGDRNQVLLGVTGSGKTFTMAQVIQQINRPTLIMAPNKTLAAQLYGEMKEFFPNNAVEYFVSYYDYYQPEAYVAKTDTYIEKDSSINEHIDRMRHSATRSLMERNDVIIVSSVSCIYGIGDVATYVDMTIPIRVDDIIDPMQLAKDLASLQYTRNDLAFARGTFRMAGDVMEIHPVHQEDRAWRVSFFGDEVEAIYEFDPLSGKKTATLDMVTVYANSHYVTPRQTISQAMRHIRRELQQVSQRFESDGKLLEKQRLEERTWFDLEMLETTGFCSGIENYSRYLTGRNPGEAPPTLFEYLPEDALLIMDESHVSVPQIGGMYKGNLSRKNTLLEHGFRLPSCVDNRPLKHEEWDAIRPQTVFVSATPNIWEVEQAEGVVVEQLIRPTGLLDPICEVRPCDTQVDDVLYQCKQVIKKQGRVLITTLTKKMAEDLTDYMHDMGGKVRYLHSDVDTLERIEILQDLRRGVFDVLIGINLLREGLDIPECMLVCILDADKEGFLRSKTSLVQTIGRAARNINGRVVLYADTMTASLEYAITETNRRRKIQQEFNKKNAITPTPIVKEVTSILDNLGGTDDMDKKPKNPKGAIWAKTKLRIYVPLLAKAMRTCAENLDFENATVYRDELQALETYDLDMPLSVVAFNPQVAAQILGKK